MYSNAIESPDSTAPLNQDILENSSENDREKIEALATDLAADSLKKQLQAVQTLAELNNPAADKVLIEFVQKCGQIDPVSARAKPARQLASNAAYGSAYQQLYQAKSDVAKAFIEQVSSGIVTIISGRAINYDDLQMLLIKQDYQAADKLTTEKMCAIAGPDAIKRKWAYFTEVSQFPNADILTIDTLWRTYSEDKFGWSKQRELWLRLGQDWDRLWPQIDWKSSAGAWTRYPTEFTWDLASAPVGHLPLFNQLRGVRVMSSLLTHPVWDAIKADEKS